MPICGLWAASAEGKAITPTRIAIGLIALLAAYFAVDNHVSLFPWNNLAQAGPQLGSTLTGVLPFALVAIALSAGYRPGIKPGIAWAAVWLVLQLRQWWLPYALGPTALHRDFGWYDAHGYAETLRFLPAIGDRPVLDALHFTLQVLSLAVLIALARVAKASP